MIQIGTKSLRQNQYYQSNPRCGLHLFVGKTKSVLIFHISWPIFGRIYWKSVRYLQGQWDLSLCHFLKSKVGRINPVFDYLIGRLYCSDIAHKNGCRHSTLPENPAQFHLGHLVINLLLIVENKLQTAFVSWAGLLKRIKNNVC